MATATWVHPDYRQKGGQGNALTVRQIKTRASTLNRTVVFRCHMSLHHGANPAAIARYVLGAVNEGMGIISTTESNHKMKREISRKLPEDWRIRRKGEYLMLWDEADYAEAPNYVKFQRITHNYKIQIWRDLRTHSLKVQVKDAKRFYRTDVGHLPATVQAGKKFNEHRNPTGVKAWKTGTKRQGKRMQGRPARLKQDFTADFNVDLDEKVWRDVVKDQIGYPTIYDAHVPEWATHRGDRLIDGAASNARIIAMGQLNTPVPKGVDHRNFWFAFEM